MSRTTRIPTDRLSTYFDDFSKRFLNTEGRANASVEVISMDVGDQFVGEAISLIGITYDKPENTIELELGSGDHRVLNPKEVWVIEEDDGFVSAIEIVPPEGAHEVVRVNRAGLRRAD